MGRYVHGHDRILIYDGEVIKVGNEHDDSVIFTNTTLDMPGEGEPTFPFLPVKYFHSLPQVGDRVHVILKQYTAEGGGSDKHMKRLWIGPIEGKWESIRSGSFQQKHELETDAIPIEPLPRNINDDNQGAKLGVYPNKNEVGINLGNTDIILSNKTINIRAGKFVFGDKSKTKFNDRNQGVINIKYGSSNIIGSEEKQIENRTVQTDQTHNIIVDVKDDGSTLFGHIKILKVTGGTISKQVYETTMSDTDLVVPNNQDKNGEYKKENKLIRKIRSKVDQYKSIYPRWKFSSVHPKLSGDTEFFNGHIQTIQVEVIKPKSDVTNSNKGGSVINVIANKINLFSHDGLKQYDDILNKNKEIGEDMQRKINKELQSIVYGEKLLSFLKLIQKFVIIHHHPFHGMPPIKDDSVLKVIKFDLDTLLNKNIKTN